MISRESIRSSLTDVASVPRLSRLQAAVKRPPSLNYFRVCVKNPWKSRIISPHHGFFLGYMMTSRHLGPLLLIILAAQCIKADEHNHIVSRIFHLFLTTVMEIASIICVFLCNRLFLWRFRYYSRTLLLYIHKIYLRMK